MDTILYGVVSGVIMIFRSLPLRLVARIGRVFGGLAHFLDARHRKVARANMGMALPEKSDAEIRELVHENFRRLGENYCSAIKTAYMTEDELRPHLSVSGAEALHETAKKHSNLVVAIGHFGNFELYSRLQYAGPRLQQATTYRALRQPSLSRLMEQMRARSGVLLFERRTGAKQLRETLRNGKVLLGLLSDQHAGRSSAWIPFFGRICSTNTAPAVLALRYDAALHTAICYRTGLARWHVEVGPELPLRDKDGEARPSEEIMLEVNRAFEAAVRRDPANWFWVHQRWKKPPADLQPVAQPEASDATI